MSPPRPNPKTAYFDSIAEAWDRWHDRATEQARILAGLAPFSIESSETVLDVGCGTGNLTAALLQHLGDGGRVVAVDRAPRMLAAAQGQIADPRVRWLHAPVERLPLDEASVDRAICYSVWPHVDDPDAAARELHRVVRPGGALHVWHLASRKRINEIHAGAGEAVRQDLLVPAARLARLLEARGWAIEAVADDAQHYLLSARRGARR